MTIGKRKGYTAKGTGAAIGSPGAVNDEVGGSLSKNDHWYLQQGFGMGVDPGSAPVPAMDATGGVINDYTTPGGDVYRSHIFTGTSNFVVNSLSDIPANNNVHYMVVAGGGGGGAGFGGAGGAGGLRTNIPGNPYSTNVAFPIPAAGTYPVVVGAGGAAGRNTGAGAPGGHSSFGSPTQGIILSHAGGHGGGNPSDKNAGPGGSGGSGGMVGGAGTPGTAVAVTTPSPWPGPSVQGYAGGTSYDPGGFGTNNTGGGGGAGAAGSNGHPSNGHGGNGGIGVQVAIAGPPTASPVGTPGPSGNGWFAGGGGGSSGEGKPTTSGGAGGGGAGGNNSQPSPGSPGTWGSNATQGTGGGGGASGGASTPTSRGGKGASGIVVVRYPIGTAAGTAKASGGSISFPPGTGKTVHTFTSSGTFVMPGSYPTTPVQVLLVAGGGSGGNRHGGGGGAGGLLQLPAANGTITNGTYSVIIGAGGNAWPSAAHGSQGSHTSFGPPATASAPTHLLALGGGVGGQYPGTTGMSSGGSGGGMSGDNGSGSPGAQPAPTVYGTTTGHGHQGGAGSNYAGDGRLGGGGGGAGGVGTDGGAPGPNTGNGGAGLQVQIAGDPNNNYYWAGGGGGGAWNAPDFRSANKGIGGSGGGGGGASWTAPVGGAPGGTGGISDGYAGTAGSTNIGGDGATNTGGGGGGNGQSNYSTWPGYGRGGSGGSGIVIIAYPT